MSELDVFKRMNSIAMDVEVRRVTSCPNIASRIAEHKIWLQQIRRERPSTNKEFKIGVYIRYFNQTKHENYLDYHKKQFSDTISLCPKWTLVGFYIDEGSSAPNMETAPEWCRLLEDCMSGKIDLIITQKVSNVSKKPYELNFCASILAQQVPPIGMYFISEDIFTLASYYKSDMRVPAMNGGVSLEMIPDHAEKELHCD